MVVKYTLCCGLGEKESCSVGRWLIIRGLVGCGNVYCCRLLVCYEAPRDDESGLGRRKRETLVLV